MTEVVSYAQDIFLVYLKDVPIPLQCTTEVVFIYHRLCCMSVMFWNTDKKFVVMSNSIAMTLS